ncbi:hypothetical protein C8T65DRAFT_694198 [Cerioporus squamosus]|nr:hypothetical protein C8T65DRAFT_694198 [Cerioporus squamosus]
MSNPPAQCFQNGVPLYPPGLPITPGGSVVLARATQTPPPQNDAAGLAQADYVPAVADDLIPMVINDTFDSVDYLQTRAILSPPRTQRPSGLDDLAKTCTTGLNLSGKGMADELLISVQSTAQIDSSQPSWSSALAESHSPVELFSPSPTVRATRQRSQISVCHPSASIASANHGQNGQHTGSGQGTATVTRNVNTDDSSDNGTDYFAYFPTPPIVDLPYYTEHILQGAPHVDDKAPEATTTQPEHLSSSHFTRQLLLDGDPGAFFHEHTGNNKKRLWPGSPNPEEVRRGLSRLRLASTMPALTGGRRLPGLEDDLGNPWGSGRRGQAGEEADGLRGLGLAFAPAMASTPSQHVRTIVGQSSMANSIPPASTYPARYQPSPHPAHASERGSDHCPALNTTRRGYEYAPPANTDTRDHDPDDQPGEPKPEKGKGKACALSPASDDKEEAADLLIANGGGGWNETELLEAHQRSLRQALNDRAGSGGGAHASATFQTYGAGPSGHSGSLTFAGEHDWRMWDDASSHPPSRHENATPQRSRHDRPGPNEPARSQWEGRDTRAFSSARRELSAFAPLPNTRAAQYMVQNMAQNTPRERHSRLYGKNIPPPAPRYREDSRDEDAMLDDDEIFPRSEEGETYEDWDEEEGELLPSALREDCVSAHLEPTDIPEGSFPAVYSDDPKAHLRKMATEWLREMWTDPANTVVFVDPFNYRYTKNDALNRRVEENIRRAMEFISELEDGIRAHARDLPTIWAIRNLTPEGVARALARRTWSFPYISFHTSPRSTSMTRWVMMLEGFLNNNEQKIRAVIHRALGEPEMRKWREQMVAANPDFEGWPADRALEAVLRTLRIESL